MAADTLARAFVILGGKYSIGLRRRARRRFDYSGTLSSFHGKQYSRVGLRALKPKQVHLHTELAVALLGLNVSVVSLCRVYPCNGFCIL